MNMKKHWCPLCDQGWVEQVSIAPIHKKGWLCAECEAFWPKKPLTEESFVQFKAWLEMQGLDAEQCEITRE